MRIAVVGLNNQLGGARFHGDPPRGERRKREGPAAICRGTLVVSRNALQKNHEECPVAGVKLKDDRQLTAAHESASLPFAQQRLGHMGQFPLTDKVFYLIISLVQLQAAIGMPTDTNGLAAES